jgi:hypothetical protein
MAQGMNGCWSVHLWKLKALIKNWFWSQIILFQFYESQHSLTLQGHVPSPQVWAIAQTIANILGLMIQQCVLNQS